METLILEDRLFDMISGNSGIVLVLINMYRKTKKAYLSTKSYTNSRTIDREYDY